MYGYLRKRRERPVFYSSGKVKKKYITSIKSIGFQAMGTKMETLYADLAEYLVFDKQKYTLEEFFSDIKTFKDGFKHVSLAFVFIIPYF